MRKTTPLEFYSTPLPGVDYSELQGKLIVIEGPDSVGRSTQVTRLRAWLEQHGHAVLDTGMARSALAGKGIQEAKKGNTLGPITMTLYYPHKVFYLRAGVKDLVSRVVLGRGHFDYWESGMDLRFGKDMYDSFVKYQTRLIHVFDRLAKTYDIEMIDATRTADEIFHELQTSISRLFTPHQGMRKIATARPATKSA